MGRGGIGHRAGALAACTAPSLRPSGRAPVLHLSQHSPPALLLPSRRLPRAALPPPPTPSLSLSPLICGTALHRRRDLRMPACRSAACLSSRQHHATQHATTLVACGHPDGAAAPSADCCPVCHSELSARVQWSCTHVWDGAHEQTLMHCRRQIRESTERARWARGIAVRPQAWEERQVGHWPKIR